MYDACAPAQLARRRPPTKYPAPSRLYRIDDFGGWDKVNTDLFDPENGLIATIYDKTTQ